MEQESFIRLINEREAMERIARQSVRSAGEAGIAEKELLDVLEFVREVYMNVALVQLAVEGKIVIRHNGTETVFTKASKFEL